MKKVVDWYKEIKDYASFDFVTPEEAGASAGEAEGEEKSE